jgi:hypothetical protein
MSRHRFDPFSFLFGALFLTVGLTVATGGSGVDAVRPFRSWPTAVILTGLVLVVWAASRVLRPEAGESPAELDGTDTSELDATDTAELDGSDTAELDEGAPP